MERILTELSSPVWWFTIVIAGIAINIFSSYLRGALDKFFSKSSSWWRNRSELRRKAWEERVRSIVSGRRAREEIITDELRTRLKSIWYLLLSIIFFCISFIAGDFILYSLIVSIVFALSFLSGFLAWRKAEEIEGILKEVEKRLTSYILKEDTDA